MFLPDDSIFIYYFEYKSIKNFELKELLNIIFFIATCIIDCDLEEL